MLRISIIEGESKRRLVLEGKLVAPWIDEVRSAYENAKAVNGRELIVDLRNLTIISTEGEGLLLELMKHGVRFQSSGVFAKEILRQLARRLSQNGMSK